MSDEKNGCPMGYGGGAPSVYSASDLTYGSYLRVEELLSLQHPESKPPQHDELLFIIIHQAYELWFKLILHEVKSAMAFIRQGEVLRAQHLIKRVTEIQKLLVQQIHILETMTPADFLKFRNLLNPASGFQSLQFRELEFVAGLKDERYLTHFKNRPEMLETLKKRLGEPDLREAFYALLKHLGHAIPDNASQLEREGNEGAKKKILKALQGIYESPEKDLPLYLLCESLVDFDQQLSFWREHHVRVVERVIGFKRGTGGSSGVAYLQSTTEKRCFPLLFEVRTELK